MKHMTITLGLSSLLLLAGCSAEAAPKLLINNVNSPINIEINGKKQDFSTYTPFRLNNIIMVPLRQIVTDLGLDVTYYDNTAHVLLTSGNTTIFLHAGKDMEQGSRYVVVDGEKRDMEAPVVVREKVTYVPLSFIRVIGASDQWVSQDQTIQLSFQNEADDGVKEDLQINESETAKLIPGNTGIGFTWGTTYMGAVNATGLPEGKGTLFYPDLTIAYQGVWKNGVPDGQGLMDISAERDVQLVGEFQKGSIVKGGLKKGNIYFFEGTFGIQKLSAGKLRLPDGTNFQGTFTPDQKTAAGVIYTNEGETLYEGKLVFEGVLALNEFTYKRSS